MRRVLFAILGVAATGVIASAADLPAKAPSLNPPIIVPAYNWTGFYVGVAGGAGLGSSTHSSPLIPIDFSGTFDVNGGIVGATAGYNWQSGPVVFGVEGDISKSWFKGSTAGVPPVFCPPGGALANCATELQWLGTARGRIGYAWDRVLPYATGGVAYGNLRGSSDNGANSGSMTRAGWTVGAGVEVMLAASWSAKLEYLYVDLGTAKSLFIRNPGAIPFDVSFRTNIVRAGLNYKFGL